MVSGANHWLDCLTLLLLSGLMATTVQAGGDRVFFHTEPGGGPRTSIREGVIGRVTTPDSHPIAGAFIQPRSLDDPSPPIPEIAILSNKGGQFAWPLRPGAYVITATIEGCRAATRQVVVTAGQVESVSFTLECNAHPQQSQ